MQVLRDDHLKIGDVYVAADSGSLTLTGEQDRGEVRLDPDEVAELLDFLRSIVVSRSDRRGAYRIQIPATCGFRATILTEHGSVSCEARDLSLTGVRLRPSSPDAVGLEVGAAIRVLLEFENESMSEEATIVRQAGSEYGLCFTSEDSDHADPQRGPARLMRLLERFWVAEAWGD